MKRVALLLILTFGAVAFAQGPGPGGRRDGIRMKQEGPMAFWKDSEIAQKLNLTDQQKQQLENTLTNYKLKLIDQRAAVQREEVKLEPLINSDNFDAGKVEQQMNALLAARGQLERTVAMMGLDVRKVLTNDQWKQLRDMRGDAGFLGLGGPGMRGDRPKGFRRQRPDDGQAPPPPGNDR